LTSEDRRSGADRRQSATATRTLPSSITYFFPAYNEEGNLTPMVERALEVLPAFASRFDIVIVDDGSRDGTEAEGRALAKLYPQVTYHRHAGNRGYGEALRSGLKALQGEVAFFTDGDQQFDLGELRLAWPLLAGADVVAGYRIKRADPPHRLFIAWTYNRLIRVMFGLRMHDVDCAFKLIRREVVQSVDPTSGGAFFSAEFLLRAHHQGFRVVEVGVHHYPRTVGKSKGATPAVILRTMKDMGALRQSLRSGDD
jgi:glycosyltransferase involved in cell wall biosynthesis